jgi:methanogenic corrinoid protein MtbC1
MGMEEIEKAVMGIASSNLEYPNQVNALIIAMVSLNEIRFEKIIATNTLQFGFENTMINIVYPFLERIGFLWQTGSINPAHEHFITNLIRQKLIVAIDGQFGSDHAQAKKYLLFLPEGETHELSLLFAAYIIKSRGNRMIYLGQNLPLDDLITTVQTYEPDYVFGIITSTPANEEAVRYAEQLAQLFPRQQILLTGYQIVSQKQRMPKALKVMSQISDLIAFVDNNSESKISEPKQISEIA